jgi:chloramphenicol-sensitive protein RarD
MTEARRGVLAMASAATIWGLSSIYYKALSNVPPIEVLSHRTVWSAVFIGLVLAAQGRAGEVATVFSERRPWPVLAVGSVTIATNWLLFIAAVQTGHALQASLGYYIFPLLAVALGVLALGERLSRLQTLAVALAALAVLILTVGLGAMPRTALLIAGTFALYGLVKTRAQLGPVISVFFETLILAPLGLIWLWGMHAGAWTDLGGRTGGVFGHDLGTSAMLAFSGPLTGGPLILFSYAARRIPYATLGLVQYLNPTLQFAVAVAVFGEPFTRWHAVAFPLIWIGLALYSFDALRQERRSRSRAISPGTVS